MHSTIRMVAAAAEMATLVDVPATGQGRIKC
jgi:hypothetical protein